MDANNSKPISVKTAEEWQEFLREVVPGEAIYLQIKDIRALKAIVAFYLSRQSEPLLG